MLMGFMIILINTTNLKIIQKIIIITYFFHKYNINRIFKIFILLTPCSNTFSQIQIEYTFSTILNGITLSKNSVLTFHEGKSYYVNSIGKGSVCVDYKGNQGDENLTVTITNTEMGNRLALDCYSLDSIGNVVYIDFKKQQMKIQELVFDEPYVYTENGIPKILWTLIPGTNIIGGYPCQKAKCTFRGREYIAWYSISLPFNIGPWKFTGLPGAILEIRDENGIIAIVANKIKRLSPVFQMPNFAIDSGTSISIDKYKTIHREVRIKKIRMHSAGMSRDSEIEQNLVKINLIEIN